MLFPSQIFLLLFLPLTVLAFHGLCRGVAAKTALLAASSFIFYAWWDPRFVPLLAVMIAANWFIARAYARYRRSAIIHVGLVLNLAVLALFKYANFFAESVLEAAGVAFEPWRIVLPLGISFFTFQQISYLVDLRRGQAPEYGPITYTAYVSFFPQLIAGPIVRHNELIPQFRAVLAAPANRECVARGLVLLLLGLAKKVFVADKLAPIADYAFAAAEGSAPGAWLAWQGAAAYSLQLYFDFSSYSDMAIGLAGLFGFDLPLNFNRPYRATSIRDFWRRWHMTLSRFFRDYLYIPLGGSRQGMAPTLAVTLITMLLCGLWHGAGWTFVAWGGLHGLGICMQRGWQRLGWHLPVALGWLLTLGFVVVGWVLFRAESFAVAAHMLSGMLTPASVGAFDDDAWSVIAIGAAFALVGKTNVELARSDWITRTGVAPILALLFVAVLMRVGQGRALEFIYFQF